MTLHPIRKRRAMDAAPEAVASNGAAARESGRDDDAARLRIVRAAIAVFVILELASCYSLWLTNGSYGPVPSAAWMPSIAAPFDAMALASLIGLAIPIGLVRDPRIFAALWLALAIARVAPDRLLWQPYVFQSALFILGLCFSKRPHAALSGMRVLVACTYVWAAIHKINPPFFEDGLGWALDDLGLPREWAHASAWVAVSVELALPLLLAFRWTRAFAAFGLSAMHVGLIVLLAMRGHNRAVWAWNAMLAVLVPLLFVRVRSLEWRSAMKGAYVWIVLAIAGIAPLLHPYGWPPYLSWRLYTGDSMDATLLAADMTELGPTAGEIAIDTHRRSYPRALSLQRYSHALHGAFIPPERASFVGVAAQLCERVDDPAMLVLVPPAGPFFGSPAENEMLRCDELRR